MRAVTIAELLQLTIDERIQLVEDLWDSIVAEAMNNPELLPVAEAQRHELSRRREEHRRNPAEALPLEEVLERIERSLG